MGAVDVARATIRLKSPGPSEPGRRGGGVMAGRGTAALLCLVAFAAGAWVHAHLSTAAGLLPAALSARAGGLPGFSPAAGAAAGEGCAGRPAAAAAGDDDKYCYECRRAAIRNTWFSSLKGHLDEWERRHGVVVRFVVGRSRSAASERSMAEEAALHGDVMRLPLEEGYLNLPNKTRTFFAAAAELYEADWVIKMDDDVYLNMERLTLAMRQWDRIGAGYVGCLKHGGVWTEPGTRWYEPRHLLLGPTYYLHAYGSIYAVKGRDDTTVGLWMLAHGVRHFEDTRLCSPNCTEASVAVLRSECAGLCAPVSDMLSLHGQPLCAAPPPSHRALPYAPSHPDHAEFEKMWV
ncbi:MAG: galactosyltransferase-domain-containing protein [Monoraphidium minutum]|nr:MAG: galactosyltransferase-domain-containing protein [Monoraphidium minutum]